MSRKTVGVGFFGKVRIPTIGHKAAIDTAKTLASRAGGQLHIALSGTAQPLTLSQKRTHAEALFHHPVETQHQTVVEFLSNMSKLHDDFTLVCGSDRAREYNQLLSRYNGNKDRSGRVPFSFKKWRIHEVAGRRTNSTKNPLRMSREELVRSVSASRLEQLAKEDKYDQFKAYHPDVNEKDVKRLYNQIRRGLSLREETQKYEMDDLIDKFSSFVCSKLNISSKPIIKRSEENGRSFGGYQPGDKTIHVVTKNRHPMDVFRTLAHELVHHKQDLDGRIKDVAREGETGSPIEDEANSMAGRIMRWWAQQCPHHFSLGSLTENTAIFVVGGPCSGKDKLIKDLAEETKAQEVDIQALLKSREASGTIIVNGSANQLQNIIDAKDLLEHNGYNTSLVFVDTSNEISKQRNEQRALKGQRMINESVRYTKYEEAQRNKEELQKLFKENMKSITNNVKFDTRINQGNQPADREWGKPSTVRIYQNDTPGQSPEDIAKWALPQGEKVLAKEEVKKVIRKKRKPTTDDNAITNPFPDQNVGVGPTLATSAKPYGLAESIERWANSAKTRERFAHKYGNLAEKKLAEAVKKLQESDVGTVSTGPKSLRKIRESIDKGALDGAPVLGAPISTGDPLPETGKIEIKKRLKRKKI